MFSMKIVKKSCGRNFDGPCWYSMEVEYIDTSHPNQLKVSQIYINDTSLRQESLFPGSKQQFLPTSLHVNIR